MLDSICKYILALGGLTVSALLGFTIESICESMYIIYSIYCCKNYIILYYDITLPNNSLSKYQM